MKQALLDWLKPVTENRYCQVIIQNDFLCGVFAGVLLTLLLWLLCRVIFSRRSCANITVNNEFGSVAVGINAIFSVIRHACASVPCLEISKVEIYRKKNLFDFHLRAVMDVEKGMTPQLMEKVAVIVRQEMTAVFGVDNIGEIKLTIKNCKHFAAEDESAEKEEYPDFIDTGAKPPSDTDRMVSLRHGGKNGKF